MCCLLLQVHALSICVPGRLGQLRHLTMLIGSILMSLGSSEVRTSRILLYCLECSLVRLAAHPKGMPGSGAVLVSVELVAGDIAVGREE
jgi:hypothetical protein